MRSEPQDPITIRDHANVVRVAIDPERFSSAVSRFLQVPNGLDGDEHSRFRALVDRYFTPEALAPFAPQCRALARDLVAGLSHDRAVDAVSEVGARYAVRAQSVWLGWPADLERPLLDWLDDKMVAARSADPVRNDEVARRFDALILSLIEPRRRSDGSRDITDRLIQDTSAGRALRDDEIVSILRNWTGGDLASIALSVGVIVHYIATHDAVAAQLRREPADERLDEAVEEMLRQDDPFPSSRRVATCDTELAGVHIHAGQRIALDWASANRDPRVFEPDGFCPGHHSASNVVYGVGPHVCPGRPLARLELRELVRALFESTSAIVLAGDPMRETPPLGGFRSVPIRLMRH
jgi:cytochrome P450